VGISMPLAELRYLLTDQTENFMHPDDVLRIFIHLLVYKQQRESWLIERLKEDLEVMPEIEATPDKAQIKFYTNGYNENVFSKSELLAFIFASINSDWDVVRGLDLLTGQEHFWLKTEDIVFDPSLSVVTTQKAYFNSKRFKELEEIKNEDVRTYLKGNNNLYKFYNGCLLDKSQEEDSSDFSVNFINSILEKFNESVEAHYELDEKRIEDIKKSFRCDDFIELRQVLTRQRKKCLRGCSIAVHPSIDMSILETISRVAERVSKLMKQEYNINMDYYRDTMNNCHGLSIMFNLFDGSFKLVQGGISYKQYSYDNKERFWQHSWLEKGDIVYDPALRIVAPKELYYKFFQKQDEYSREETENMLKRIGFNLTHFRDFMSGAQIGNYETFRYRCLLNKIDSPEMKEEGEKLIRLVEIHNQ